MSVSRRQVIAALGSATAVGAFASTHQVVSAEDGGPVFPPSPEAQDADVGLAVALTAGLSYVVIDPTAFGPFTTASGGQILSSNGAGVAAASGALVAPIVLPVGVTLKEVTLGYVSVSGTATLSFFRKPLMGSYTQVGSDTLLPAGPGFQTITITVNEPVDGQSTFMAAVVMGTTSQRVGGLIAGYAIPSVPTPPAFVPINPVNRVLDTRNGSTKLGPGEERVVVLGVPGSASAAVINLTITQTEGAGGFVAVFRADQPWPGNSSINWVAANQDVANTVVTATDAGGSIRIHGATASTHVVIDVQGYLR